MTFPFIEILFVFIEMLFRSIEVTFHYIEIMNVCVCMLVPLIDK